MIPHTLVLEPGLRVYKIYNGYWFFGRPTVEELRLDLRAVLQRCRPDWDISSAEQRDSLGEGREGRFLSVRKNAGAGVRRTGLIRISQPIVRLTRSGCSRGKSRRNVLSRLIICVAGALRTDTPAFHVSPVLLHRYQMKRTKIYGSDRSRSRHDEGGASLQAGVRVSDCRARNSQAR